MRNWPVIKGAVNSNLTTIYKSFYAVYGGIEAWLEKVFNNNHQMTRHLNILTLNEFAKKWQTYLAQHNCN